MFIVMALVCIKLRLIADMEVCQKTFDLFALTSVGKSLQEVHKSIIDFMIIPTTTIGAQRVQLQQLFEALDREEAGVLAWLLNHGDAWWSEEATLANHGQDAEKVLLDMRRVWFRIPGSSKHALQQHFSKRKRSADE